MTFIKMIMAENRHILIVDDELPICQIVRKILSSNNYEVSEAHTGKEALQKFIATDFDLVLLDLALPDSNGIDILRKMLQKKPMTAIVLISGQGKLADAVAATKIGAYDFLEKPLDRNRILVTVRNALAQVELRNELESYKQELLREYKMIGKSDAIQVLYHQIEQIAGRNTPIFITGENGVGKELVALAIHQRSKRAQKPLIKINCAAIPETLFETELFGHAKGAFTGAHIAKKGKIQAADGGTIFFDEIGEMKLEVQAKVLRFLDSGEIQRIGSDQTNTVNVRVLAASNKNLEQMVKNGEFRKDLYFRLNVFNIHVPSLRERKEDIPLLVDYFLERYAEENGVSKPSISASALSYLSGYDWPGNIRELRNVVERMMIVTDDNLIDLHTARISLHTGSAHNSPSEVQNKETLKEVLRSCEREYILRTLEQCNWKVAEAAKALGIDRANLYRKMKRLGIKM